MHKKLLWMVLGSFLAAGVHAQVVDATKQTGHAIAEGTKEGADKTKAAFESGPSRAVDKTKAAGHKAKAKYHRHKAKQAADAAVH